MFFFLYVINQLLYLLHVAPAKSPLDVRKHGGEASACCEHVDDIKILKILRLESSQTIAQSQFLPGFQRCYCRSERPVDVHFNH